MGCTFFVLNYTHKPNHCIEEVHTEITKQANATAHRGGCQISILNLLFYLTFPDTMLTDNRKYRENF